MRPLYALGVETRQLPADESGLIQLDDSINTDDIDMIVVNHQSNVNGVIQPLEQIAAWAAKRGVALMVDTSQSLGELPIEVDYAIFTGHKSLHGPTGTGGFYARNPDKIATMIHGGTGSRSESLDMPDNYPDRFEAGTPNMVGLVGLCAALENPPVAEHTKNDFRELLDNIKGYKIYKSTDQQQQGELFSLTHPTIQPSEIAHRLFTDHGIECRSGLQCAPQAHRTIGTFPSGTLRISLSPYHTRDDLQYLLMALESIC